MYSIRRIFYVVIPKIYKQHKKFYNKVFHTLQENGLNCVNENNGPSDVWNVSPLKTIFMTALDRF